MSELYFVALFIVNYLVLIVLYVFYFLPRRFFNQVYFLIEFI